MSGTWWIGQSQLDEDQRDIISLPMDRSVLVTGPPGSGKTNLLLLRANYLHLAGKANIAVVTFTRPLREFIASGAANYDFPASKIMTCREWQHDFMRQYEGNVDSAGAFEEVRKRFADEISRVVDRYSLSNIYDAILLDEAQDYLPEEIRIFAQLANKLFCVADERQKIYLGDDALGTIRDQVDDAKQLKFHYRNGVNICKVADGIAQKWHGYQPLAETCNYDEAANPSSVDRKRCGSFEDEVNTVLARIPTQSTAFPNELIGVLCPTNDGVSTIWDKLVHTEVADKAFLLSSGVAEAFPKGKHIVVSTFHAAKGLEFRALHLVGADQLSSGFFTNNRRMAFTAVTRAKTSLSVYHTGDLYGYFESAINALTPFNNNAPSLDDVFGGSK